MSEEKNIKTTKNVTTNISPRDRFLSQKDLPNILPFGRTKIQQLLNSGQLPMVKIGKDYVTTYGILEDWIREHIGSEIYY